jgi:hypothetical protein
MDRELCVPLEQLESIDASDDTEQAIADWHYWLERRLGVAGFSSRSG